MAFTLFSIFTALQFTVATLPIALRCMAEANVCFERLKKFLLLAEYVHPASSGQVLDNNEDLSIVFNGYNAAREIVKEPIAKPKEKKSKETENLVKDESVQVLFDVNLDIHRGALIGVAGAVGSGKSSLIAGIMGELSKLGGEVKVRGRLALVPQQAWIYSGTVRENILFGSKYDEEVFEKVVESAALKQDLQNWPQADQTEVGERGLSLSGGQKQRISLARALYAILDDKRTEGTEFVVLLDDPLSAVDASVAKHIFEHCITGLLKDHTVLLVTHGIQFLSKCDKIAFMKNGTIAEYGTYEQLMSSGQDFVSMSSYNQNSNLEAANDNTASKTGSEAKKRTISITSHTEENIQGAQMKDEEQDQMNAGWPVLLKYYEACGGYFVMFSIFFIVFLFAMVRLFTSIWLQIWLDAGDGQVNQRLNASLETGNETYMTDAEMRGNIADNPDLWMYQLVHGMSLLVLVVVGLCKGFAMATALLKGSSTLHRRMLERVMRCPMSFFDTTPAGRVMNRFSKDMDESK